MIKNKKYSDLLILEDKKLKDAVFQLNKYKKKVLFVIQKNNKVLGSISDGDIRYSLLKGYGLNDNVKKFLNKKFIFLNRVDQFQEQINIIKKQNVNFIPICNEKMKLLDIVNIKQINKKLKITNPLVILAGGLGKRMMPLTKETPKPMLLINKKPIIEHIINNAINLGFQNIIISLGYLGHKIQNYFDDGSKLGIKIKYIREKKPLGTAGFLNLLKIKHNNFVVTNGDVLSNINYKDLLEFNKKQQALATMTIQEKKNNESYGVVISKGKNFINVKEKPVIKYFVNSGTYALNSKAIKFVKKNQYTDMTDLFNLLKKNKKKILVYPSFENWIDIANYKDLKHANRKIDKFINYV